MGYLRPALKRGNVSLLPCALAHRLLFDGVGTDSPRATGVEVEFEGQLVQFRAKREVILSSGAISSPQLLLLSGIGAPSQLEAHGVAVVHPLPGVGCNLQDHQSLGVMFRAREPVSLEYPRRAPPR